VQLNACEVDALLAQRAYAFQDDVAQSDGGGQASEFPNLDNDGEVCG